MSFARLVCQYLPFHLHPFNQSICNLCSHYCCLKTVLQHSDLAVYIGLLCDSIKTHHNVQMVCPMFDQGWFYNPVCFLWVVRLLLYARKCLTASQSSVLHVSSLMEQARVWIFENCNNKKCKLVVTCKVVAILCTCMSQTGSRVKVKFPLPVLQ